jgi:hypothetical protein
MPYLIFHLVLTFCLDLLQVLARSKQDQALEVLVLRQQLRIALRTAPSTPRLSRWEKGRCSHWTRWVIPRDALGLSPPGCMRRRSTAAIGPRWRKNAVWRTTTPSRASATSSRATNTKLRISQ